MSGATFPLHRSKSPLHPPHEQAPGNAARAAQRKSHSLEGQPCARGCQAPTVLAEAETTQELHAENIPAACHKGTP